MTVHAHVCSRLYDHDENSGHLPEGRSAPDKYMSSKFSALSPEPGSQQERGAYSRYYYWHLTQSLEEPHEVGTSTPILQMRT